MPRITQLPVIDAESIDPENDLMVVVDTSDTTEAATGSTKGVHPRDLPVSDPVYNELALNYAPYNDALSDMDLGEYSLTAAALIASGLTLGSVLFVAAGGVFAQDVGEFYWDSTNHKLGIGLGLDGEELPVAPTHKLHVVSSQGNVATFVGSGLNSSAVVMAYNDNGGETNSVSGESAGRFDFACRHNGNPLIEIASIKGVYKGDGTTRTGNLIFQVRQVSNFDLMELHNEGYITVASRTTTTGQMRLKSQRTGIVSGSVIGGIDCASDDTSLTTPGTIVATFRAVASVTHTASALGTDWVWQTTTGTTLSERMRLSALGVFTLTGTFIHATTATPASASATGVTGTIAWDANFIYVCVATNTWKRIAIATW